MKSLTNCLVTVLLVTGVSACMNKDKPNKRCGDSSDTFVYRLPPTTSTGATKKPNQPK